MRRIRGGRLPEAHIIPGENTMRFGRPYRLVALALIACLGGCTAAFSMSSTQRTTSSSMVDFLYPEGERPVVDAAITPRLELPLRVGIAFVPASKQRWPYDSGWPYDSKMPEKRRIELLKKVEGTFETVDYIEAVEVIPSTYLGSRGGFDALEQVSRLYDLDVFALVSWDQVMNTDDTIFSILYWTIVGGYVIPASRNTVNTMLDTAVFDMRTRKLLLRAPGFDVGGKQTTAIGAGPAQRRLSDSSFERAIYTMTENLEAEVKAFGERVKEDKSVEIAYSDNYRGAYTPLVLLLALALALLAPARDLRRSRG